MAAVVIAVLVVPGGVVLGKSKNSLLQSHKKLAASGSALGSSQGSAVLLGPQALSACVKLLEKSALLA